MKNSPPAARMSLAAWKDTSGEYMFAGNWRLRTSPARATLTTRSVRHRYDDGREPPSRWPSRPTASAGRGWGPGRAAGARVKGLTDDRPVELMAARPGA